MLRENLSLSCDVYFSDIMYETSTVLQIPHHMLVRSNECRAEAQWISYVSSFSNGKCCFETRRKHRKKPKNEIINSKLGYYDVYFFDFLLTRLAMERKQEESC